MTRSSFLASFLALLAGILLISAWRGPAHAQSAPKKGELLSGSATVVEGDTFDFRVNRVRVWGIFSPEQRAWCWRNGQRWEPAGEAAKALRECLKGDAVTCRVQRSERRWFRKRYVSECWTDDGRDVGACMVRAGWATDYSCYSGGHYRDLEAEAKHGGLGLWTCDNGPPTRRWGRKGRGVLCETPAYKPSGPAPK